MALMRLRYVNQFRDRHGKVRYYFRRPGHSRVSPCPAFLALMSSWKPIKRRSLDRDAAQDWHEQQAWYDCQPCAQLLQLATSSRRIARRHSVRSAASATGLLPSMGQVRRLGLRQEHVTAMVEANTATPSAARNLLAFIRALMEHAHQA